MCESVHARRGGGKGGGGVNALRSGAGGCGKVCVCVCVRARVACAGAQRSLFSFILILSSISIYLYIYIYIYIYNLGKLSLFFTLRHGLPLPDIEKHTQSGLVEQKAHNLSFNFQWLDPIFRAKWHMQAHNAALLLFIRAQRLVEHSSLSKGIFEASRF